MTTFESDKKTNRTTITCQPKSLPYAPSTISLSTVTTSSPSPPSSPSIHSTGLGAVVADLGNVGKCAEDIGGMASSIVQCVSAVESLNLEGVENAISSFEADAEDAVHQFNKSHFKEDASIVKDDFQSFEGAWTKVTAGAKAAVARLVETPAHAQPTQDLNISDQDPEIGREMFARLGASRREGMAAGNSPRRNSPLPKLFR